uniref:Uncharacterized protein n=1 Tax=Arundo donax TaxID=35708 RepID=A0A0A9BTU4_ARUDO
MEIELTSAARLERRC